MCTCQLRTFLYMPTLRHVNSTLRRPQCLVMSTSTAVLPSDWLTVDDVTELFSFLSLCARITVLSCVSLAKRIVFHFSFFFEHSRNGAKFWLARARCLFHGLLDAFAAIYHGTTSPRLLCVDRRVRVLVELSTPTRSSVHVPTAEYIVNTPGNRQRRSSFGSRSP